MYTFPVFIHRILVMNMMQFANSGRDIQWHIPNKYEDNMSKKSTVVSRRMYTKQTV